MSQDAPVIATADDCQLPAGTVFRLDAIVLDDGRLKVRCTYTPTGETEPKLYGRVIPKGDDATLAGRLQDVLIRCGVLVAKTGITIPKGGEPS